MALDSSTGKSACATRAKVTFAALLHPAVCAAAVDSFRTPAPGLKIVPDLHGIESADAALIFGGDGTVHRHLSQLHKQKIPTLVVPKGSGNDFAKALGITNEKVALAAWKEFLSSGGKNVRDIDLGRIKSAGGETLFCCVAGAGLDSAANVVANQMPSWLRGTAGYLLAAVRSLVTFQPARFAINTDSSTIRRQGFFVAVGNAHRYGHGMRIAPQAELDDGLLDICMVGAMNKVKLLFSIPTVFLGTHLRIKQVDYVRAARLRIETDPALDLFADGEFACATPVDIDVLPQALRIIVPI